jgi:hypothetical protein
LLSFGFYGVKWSGIVLLAITSYTGNTSSYTDNTLTNLATGYYYSYITETDGKRAVTAPIWYIRNDAALLPDYFDFL